MFDPFANDTPGMADPARNLIALAASDTVDIKIGIKSLRIWNPNATAAVIHVITILGETVAFTVPPTSLTIEPLRISRLLTATTAGVEVFGYSDNATPA